MGQSETSRRKLDPGYIAGFIDADGHIGIRHGNTTVKGWRHQAVVVTVVQSDPLIPTLLAERYGGRVGVNRRNTGLSIGREYHRWTASGTRAEAILRDILPFIVAKKEQCEIALSFLDHKKGLVKAGCRTEKGNPQLLTKGVLAFREKCWLRMKELNTCHKRRAVAETKSSDPVPTGMR